MNRAILTYSAMSSFLNCNRQYYNRDIRMLVTKDRDPVLDFGSVWHGALERWYTSGDQVAKIRGILKYIDDSFPNRERDPQQKRDWFMLHAMFEEYLERYPEEAFDVIAAETKFVLPIINPSSGRISRTFLLSGKVDGLIRMKDSGELYVMEHKTAAKVDESYLEKLPLDFQINLYSYALSRHLNQPITGVLYNVVQKTTIRQNPGESEDDFEKRRAVLIAKSKTGTTTAKRQLPESDDEFRDRMRSKYHEPEMFIREQLLISRADLNRTEDYVWKITQKILAEMKAGDWLGNGGCCFKYGKPCQYWALCRSGDNDLVRENCYDVKQPHEELAEEATPLF